MTDKNLASKIIMVVCRGNIARSAVAEFILNREIKKKHLGGQMIAISRGTQGTTVDPIPVKFPNITFYTELYAEAKPILDEMKIDITKHISKPIMYEDAEKASVILAVDTKVKSALLTLFPDFGDKIYLLSELVNKNNDFADPAEAVDQKGSQVFERINQTITQGFSRLLELL